MQHTDTSLDHHEDSYSSSGSIAVPSLIRHCKVLGRKMTASKIRDTAGHFADGIGGAADQDECNEYYV